MLCIYNVENMSHFSSLSQRRPVNIMLTGMPKGLLTKNHSRFLTGENNTQLRGMRYTPPGVEEKMFRRDSHVDYTTVTFLVHADNEGLQVSLPLHNLKIFLKNL